MGTKQHLAQIAVALRCFIQRPDTQVVLSVLIMPHEGVG